MRTVSDVLCMYNYSHLAAAVAAPAAAASLQIVCDQAFGKKIAENNVPVD